MRDPDGFAHRAYWLNCLRHFAQSLATPACRPDPSLLIVQSADPRMNVNFADTPLSFGRYLSESRKRLGISQKELAGRILKEDGEPISPQYLNDLERARRFLLGLFL